MNDNKEHSEKSLRDQAPILFSLSKEKVMSPEGYFDNLSDKVMSRITSQETPIEKLPAKQNRWIWIAAAAVIGLLVGLSIFGSQPAVDMDNRTAEFVPDLELDQEYLLAIEEDFIIEAYLDELEDADAERNAYIDYLLESDLELDDLLNEL